MTTCSDCFNNCDHITSDQCVRYTGLDIPLLEIKNGDSLSYVENAIIEFLTSTLDGTGIKPDIDPTIICDLVKNNLPTCGDITIVDVVTALIKSTCDLQEQIDNVNETLTTLNADYTIGCLTGVITSSGTHAILQAVITQLCTTVSNLSTLSLDVLHHYVRTSDMDTIIQDYLDSIGSSTLMKNKMIPYVAVEYYGPLTDFDITGAGTGNWINIYLCNGNHSTPDKRGRIPVGTTTGMGGAGFNPAVDPGISGNPSYYLYSTQGANNVTLSASQMPGHTHVVALTDPSHKHYEFNSTASATGEVSVTSVTYPNYRHDVETGLSYRVTGTSTVSTLGPTSPSSTGITVVNASTGGNLSHPNIPPVLACHYIIYLP